MVAHKVMNMKQDAEMASAGSRGEEVRSDCWVEVGLRRSGGVSVEIESKVGALYGTSIRALAEKVAESLGVSNARISVVDAGALPFVIAARLECAFKRADPGINGSYLPPFLPRPKRPESRPPLRRSRLYLPGNQPKFMINAGLHGPDAVILDLEDSVPPGEKDSARLLVRNALRSLDFYGAERMVRINAADEGLIDIAHVLPGGPDVIVVPKCDSPAQVREITRAINASPRSPEMPAEVRVLPIIETPLGVVNAFAVASADKSVCALAIGLEDLTAHLGTARTRDGLESLYARQAVVLAARAAGVQPLDSVYSDVSDVEGLRESCKISRRLGFDGVGCIHPRQIDPIHQALAPTVEELEWARKVKAASGAAEAAGQGAVAVDSQMVDPPVVRRAERLLEIANRVGLKV